LATVRHRQRMKRLAGSIDEPWLRRLTATSTLSAMSSLVRQQSSGSLPLAHDTTTEFGKQSQGRENGKMFITPSLKDGVRTQLREYN
jgi:hypothetical protein